MNSDMTVFIILVAAALLSMVGLALQVAFLLTLQRALERCAPSNRTVAPGQVWFNLIPLFNIVWQFILVARISETLGREFAGRAGDKPAPGSGFGREVGLPMCVLFTLSIIPFVGILCAVVGMVFWIIYWIRISDYSRMLASMPSVAVDGGIVPGELARQLDEPRRLGAQMLVLVILLFGWSASYVQRIALSSLAPEIRRALEMPNAKMAWVLSAFLFGLMAGYILITLVTAFCGTRWGLVAVFAGSSVAACASGLFPTVTGLIVCRFLLGLFAGGLLPAAVQAAREWFPSKLRPLVIGAFLACGPLAAMSVPPVLALLGRLMNWSTLLALTALPAAIVAVLCVAAWPSLPSREPHGGVSGAAFASTAMLAVGLFLAAPVSYFATGWLPLFLRTRLGVGDDAVGTVAVQVAGCCGALMIGVIAWALMSGRSGASKTRAAMLTACGCLLPLMALGGIVEDRVAVVTLAALSLAAYHGWATLLYSAVADTLPARGVAVGAAIGALFSGVAGMAAPLLMGLLIEGPGYAAVFLQLAATSLIALLAVGLLAWLVRQEPAS